MRELTRISTELRETNLAGQLFFQHVGFMATRVLREHFADTGEAAYLMQCTVPAATPQAE